MFYSAHPSLRFFCDFLAVFPRDSANLRFGTCDLDGPIRANRLRVSELHSLVCESRFGALKIANCRFEPIRANRSNVMKIVQCHAEGGATKGGVSKMRANANKRRQTLTNAEAKTQRRKRQRRKRKQTRANVDKRKQTLTPPFIAVFYTPLCNPLNSFFLRITSRESMRESPRFVLPIAGPSKLCDVQSFNAAIVLRLQVFRTLRVPKSESRRCLEEGCLGLPGLFPLNYDFP